MFLCQHWPSLSPLFYIFPTHFHLLFLFLILLVASFFWPAYLFDRKLRHSCMHLYFTSVEFIKCLATAAVLKGDLSIRIAASQPSESVVAALPSGLLAYYIHVPLEAVEIALRMRCARAKRSSQDAATQHHAMLLTLN
jgi:hypothetical protein